MNDPTYLSLFSGIGGLDLAAEQHGFRCVGQVEVDAACTRVLERWWPTVPRWGDVRELTAASYAADGLHGDGRGSMASAATGWQRGAEGADRRSAARGRGTVDLICGGFPCQPVSTAGRRKGQADDRWLWPEYARVVGELRPRLVLVENVPGLLTVNGGRAFSEVLGDLASLGYDTRWTSLRASEVGAPHRRERIFLLAHARRSGLEGEQRAALHVAEHDGRVATDADGRPLRRTSAAGDGLPEPREHGAFPWGAYEPAIRRWEAVMGPAPHPVDDRNRLAPAFVEWMQGFEPGWTDQMSRTQALKALGNAVVPQQGAAALGLLLEDA